MRSIAHWPESARRRLRGVFFDIDDTLTSGGRLTARAYEAMERLQHATLTVVPITGRPAGWCDHIARMWPVDAVVGENGAFFFRYDRNAHRMDRHYVDSPEIRAAQRAKLAAIGEEIVSSVRGAAIAADQAYRESDLAIDFREDVPALDDRAVDEIVSIMRQHGLTAKVSSIHVNGWFGNHDKLSMTQTLMTARLRADAARDADFYAFVGDSPNDAPMFAFFENSIGVANVRDFDGRIDTPPTFVTDARSGEGFCEAVDAILNARR
jgi:HAD superfamily hydrolase (TIGR01484 family)